MGVWAAVEGVEEAAAVVVAVAVVVVVVRAAVVVANAVVVVRAAVFLGASQRGVATPTSQSKQFAGTESLAGHVQIFRASSHSKRKQEGAALAEK